MFEEDSKVFRRFVEALSLFPNKPNSVSHVVFVPRSSSLPSGYAGIAPTSIIEEILLEALQGVRIERIDKVFLRLNPIQIGPRCENVF